VSALKRWWRQRRPGVHAILGTAVVRFLGRTARRDFRGFDALPPAHIIAGWHGRSLLFVSHPWPRPYWVMISQSNDGEMQSRIFRAFGFKIIRGSTGRGGARAAVEAIRALRNGEAIAMTPDGPRGPTQIVQPGIMTLAQKSGAPIVPAGLSATPRKIIRSWDRYLLPAPFCRCICIAGDPIYVPADASEEAVEAIRLRVQHEINRLTALTESELGLTSEHRSA
jgi:hypothetical protein